MTTTTLIHRVCRRLLRMRRLASDRAKLLADGLYSSLLARLPVEESGRAGAAPNTFDASFVLWLFGKYSRELPHLYKVRRLRIALEGQYDDFEGAVLYMIVRHFKPEIVAELGTHCGYSTLYILSALEVNQCGKLYSFELDAFYQEAARRVVEAENLAHRLELVAGDCRETFARTEAQIGLIDLLSVDADHSYEFGKWWTTALPGKLQRQGIIHVHDVLFEGNWKSFKPRCGFGEGVAVGEFLTAHSTEYAYFSNYQLGRDPVFMQRVREYWHQPFRLSMDNHSPSVFIRHLGRGQN